EALGSRTAPQIDRRPASSATAESRPFASTPRCSREAALTTSGSVVDSRQDPRVGIRRIATTRADRRREGAEDRVKLLALGLGDRIEHARLSRVGGILQGDPGLKADLGELGRVALHVALGAEAGEA